MFIVAYATKSIKTHENLLTSSHPFLIQNYSLFIENKWQKNIKLKTKVIIQQNIWEKMFRLNVDFLVAWCSLYVLKYLTQVDCSVDATYFPFDNQICSIELTSWGLPDTEMNMQLLWDRVHMDEYRYIINALVIHFIVN